MFVVDKVLGNTHRDEPLALDMQAKAKTGAAEHVEVSFHDAQRRRLRLTTPSGLEVGVDISHAHGLQDGDVLSGGDGTKFIVIDVAAAEAMALQMDGSIPPEELFAYGVRLGHMLGNQHWPVSVENDVVMTPVNIARKVMETVVRTHGFPGVVWEFIPVEPGRVPTGMPHIEHNHD